MSDDDTDYEVGYCKPPIDTRWKKGQSGNSRGRPSRAQRAQSKMMRDISMELANEMIPVTINGKRQFLPAKWAIVKGIINDALAGTPAQRARAFVLLREIGAFDVDPNKTGAREAMNNFIAKLAAEAQKQQELEELYPSSQYSRS